MLFKWVSGLCENLVSYDYDYFLRDFYTPVNSLLAKNKKGRKKLWEKLDTIDWVLVIINAEGWVHEYSLYSSLLFVYVWKYS